jgi:protein-tyrosine phosphatase
VIDLHAHVLPGLDDGVRSLEEACDLVRRSHAGGVGVIAATPHVRDDYPTTPEQMEDGVATLRAELASEGIPVEVVEGGELALDRLGLLSEDDVRRFSFGQRGHCVLLECPYFGTPLELMPAIHAVRDWSLVPLVAHPERNPDLMERPERGRALVEAGALLQVTALSVSGGLGPRPRAAAEKLLELGLVHVLASDAHGPHIREGGLAEAAEAIRDAALAAYLTEEAPAAILAGEHIKPPPPRRRRRRRLPFLTRYRRAA